jgi:hypothetical protein
MAALSLVADAACTSGTATFIATSHSLSYVALY